MAVVTSAATTWKAISEASARTIHGDAQPSDAADRFEAGFHPLLRGR